MKTCIYTKSELQNADGEHILQNFLGARWVSKDISCNEAQALFGRTIDLALEQGLREFRNFLGTKGGRGGDGPDLKNVKDSQGNKYHIRPGGTPHLAEPIIVTNALGDGAHATHVQLGDMKQLEWAIAKLRQQFPNAPWDIEKIKKQLVSGKTYLNDKLHLKPSIGGKDYFRGLLKSAFNLLGANESNIALLPCFDKVRCFILSGSGEMRSHIRWLHTSEELAISALGPFDHFVGIYSNGKVVDGIVQFFGGISHIVRLANDYDGPEFRFGYQVNPLRDSDPAETRTPNFDPKNFPQFDDGHEMPGEDVWPIYTAIFSRFLEKYFYVGINNEISRIVDEVCGAYKEGDSLDELMGEIAEQFSRFVLSRIQAK